MRLDPEHHDSTVAQAVELVEAMERRVLSLSALSKPEQVEVIRLLVEDVISLSMYCSSFRTLGEMMATLKELEAFLSEIALGAVSMNDRVGGLLLHSIATFRHGVAGAGSRSGERLPKVFGDLRRVMGNLRKRPAPVAVSNAVSVSDSDSVAETAAVTETVAATETDYRSLFFADPSLMQLQSLVSALESDPTSLGESVVNEWFRIFHTLKGNSALIGYSEITSYAHAVEDVLKLMREGKIKGDTSTGRFLIGCGRCLKGLLERRRNARPADADSVADVTAYISEVVAFVEGRAQAVSAPSAELPVSTTASFARVGAKNTTQDERAGFYLRVKVAGRELMIPCQTVADVVRNPKIMALPGGRKGWEGLIRSRGNLVPLVHAGALVEGLKREPWNIGPAWVVVFVGLNSTNDENGFFAVPVEEVYEVVEFPFEHGTATILDLSKINIWA